MNDTEQIIRRLAMRAVSDIDNLRLDAARRYLENPDATFEMIASRGKIECYPNGTTVLFIDDTSILEITPSEFDLRNPVSIDATVRYRYLHPRAAP